MVRALGHYFLNSLAYFGELWGLTLEVFQSLSKTKIRRHELTKQIAEIGFRSQPVVIITGAFTGAVLAAQSLFQFTAVNLETAAGALVSVAMLRELGPSITALMLAGRVGSGMAAEIGTMKVAEQIDALRSMSVHPVDYLVTPRFVAMLISVPLLIAESALFGIMAATLIGVHMFNVPVAYWWSHIDHYTELSDIAISCSKGLVFGFLIVIISCHQGLSASNGAVGVGRGTTHAMVYSSLAVLISNFFLTMLSQIFFPSAL